VTALLKFWDTLRSSFWFVPALMAALATALAFGSVALDEAVGAAWVRKWSWGYSGSADGASMLLGTVAGSMITIAGTVFSMTLVALSLASSQLGPRLLRNFMRDAVNQVVLGTFVATFVYCLLVLRTIRYADADAFVPHLSVTIGVMLAMVSLGVLIYFIHHVSVSIQADEVVARVGQELARGIDQLFPEPIGHGRSRMEATLELPQVPPELESQAFPVPADRDGYLQTVDAAALMGLAEREDLFLRLERKPGQYLVKGQPLVLSWPADRSTADVATRINAAFVIGNQRTSVQDIGFSIEQLVEVAVRALSPGVNDPFTALTCVDRLCSALCHLARREMPSPYRFDAAGQLRVVAPATTFSAAADAAFDPIRQSANASAAVTRRLLEVIAVIASATQRPLDRAVLLRHAEMIARGSRTGLAEEADRQTVATRMEQVRLALAAQSRDENANRDSPP
jgi:uncharacterized membrane protein